MKYKQGQIRIIGGKWRSRIIQFPNLPDLRPSPDMTREMLFNWLQPFIQDSHCLDLFAGSGAFGFEAASRRAKSVTLIESSRPVADQLIKNRGLLDADEFITVINSKAEQFMDQCDQKYDLIFLDPPFHSQFLSKTCDALSNNQILADQALIYIESPKSNAPLPIAPSWHIIRQKTRGNVNSTLIQT